MSVLCVCGCWPALMAGSSIFSEVNTGPDVSRRPVLAAPLAAVLVDDARHLRRYVVLTVSIVRVPDKNMREKFLRFACQSNTSNETLILLSAPAHPCRNAARDETIRRTSRATGKEGLCDAERRDHVHVEDREQLDRRLPGALQDGRRLLRPGQASHRSRGPVTSRSARQGQQLAAGRR
jgi:hypothetical protein